MSVVEYTKKILEELSYNVRYEDDEQLNQFVTSITEAQHIFLAGTGRSGVAIRAFSNRLMHLGMSISVVGDITNPAAQKGDLLILGSGSGETESLVSLAKKAKKLQVTIALVTMDMQSSIAESADIVVVLPGVSPKLKNNGSDIQTIQPMGSAFEQLSLITYDGIILELMSRLKETTDAMFSRHANLE